MGILSKIFSGGKSKTASSLKQAAKMLGAGKLDETKAILDDITASISEETLPEDLASLVEHQNGLALALLNGERLEEALELADKLAQDNGSHSIEMAKLLVKQERDDTRSLGYVLATVEDHPQDKKLLLVLAKVVFVKYGDNLEGDYLDFLQETAKAYPLWKDGSGVLADIYLKDNRRDAEALVIYRNAYPNRKADMRLREVLIHSLIENHELDEFAASVYKDAIETSDNVEALELLAQHYIATKQFDSSTVPYIQRALEKCKLPQDSLKALALLARDAEEGLVDRMELCTQVYQQGYADRDLLAYLGEALAAANKFDDLSIEIMIKAFELKVVSKRAMLILTEHCLANDREDDFALSVYESYLSTWPDRPQRRIYTILGHHYAGLTRVDDQAQKIYEDALVDTPTDPVILTMLARAYHAADRRDDAADEVYRHAFPSVDEETRKSLAAIMAQSRVEANDYSEETLKYLTVMGPPTSGPLAAKYDESLTNCFLATGRRGEQAQEAYFSLFEKTADSPDVNRKLVELLAEIIKEQGVAPAPGSIELRVYSKLFELHKFATDPDVSFILLEDLLTDRSSSPNLLNVCVRCFEADADKFVKLLNKHTALQMLQEVGNFYTTHYNFPLAAQAYQASFDITPTDHVRYHLAKIQILDGHGSSAVKLLKKLDAPEYSHKRKYWEAVAYQLQGNAEKSREMFGALDSGEIPQFIIDLRQTINDELSGDLPGALENYRSLSNNKEFEQFDRWIQLEIGICLIKLNQLKKAMVHLEDIHHKNPNSRAEQLFYSLALFLQAHHYIEEGDLGKALPMFTKAIEVNRNHRQLRQAAVDILGIYGQQAFFAHKLDLSAKLFETSMRILPKQVSTKTFLAYTYHLLEDYPRAIIHYRDIGWSDDNPGLQRSQAYAYLANQQPGKAWRVFQDLARRGNLMAENFPRLVGSFLNDPESSGGMFWENIKFPKKINPLLLIALLIHDGQYDKAIEHLGKEIKAKPQDPALRWYMGKAHSHLDKKELSVYNWKELLDTCGSASTSPATKNRQFTEIGLAFLEAGYADEAMQTWEQLRKLDEKNPDLPLLYAETLSLNAYQLAKKGQDKLACAEWGKAVKFDPENPELVQNHAIACLQLMDLKEATKQFGKLNQLWQAISRKNGAKSHRLAGSTRHIEHAMNTFALTKGRSEQDVTKARAEETIEVYRKANQFYWILRLEKGASIMDIEREYFRLIKIFNPERHADDFMLVEESYTNLFKSQNRRQLIDLFVYNPIDAEKLRSRLSRLQGARGISFESLELPTNIPPADYQQLHLTGLNESQAAQPMMDLLSINFKIPDWTIL